MPARRAVTRAAGLAAITFLMLGTLSGPAVAQVVRDHRTNSGGSGAAPAVGVPDTPLRVYATQLYCVKESNDNTWPSPDHDEPYAVFFVADLRGETARARVLLSGHYEDVDSGDLVDLNRQIWSLDDNGSPIRSSDDYIILTALMEEDDYRNPLIILNNVSRLVAVVQNYKRAGMSRAEMVSALRADMERYIDETQDRQYGGGDDRVGPIIEIVWSQDELERARTGRAVEQTARFVGSDSSYRLTFRLQ